MNSKIRTKEEVLRECLAKEAGENCTDQEWEEIIKEDPACIAAIMAIELYASQFSQVDKLIDVEPDFTDPYFIAKISEASDLLLKVAHMFAYSNYSHPVNDTSAEIARWSFIRGFNFAKNSIKPLPNPPNEVK